MKSGHHAPSNGLAVQQSLVAGHLLQRMANRVPQVQDHSEAGLALVDIHHLGLHADRRCNHFFQRLRVPPQHIFGMLLHKAQQRPVADNPRLYALHQPGAQLAIRQGPEHSDICEHRERMVKAAEKVFTLGQIHAGLAAHRAVHLREESGGNLNVRDSTHVRRCQKSAHIADNSAAKGYQERAAITARRRHLPRQFLCASQGFVLLAWLKKKRHRRLGKGAQEGLRPKPPYRRRSDYKNPPRQLARNSLDARGQRLNKAAARNYVVFGRWCMYSYGLHAASILKQRCLHIHCGRDASSLLRADFFHRPIPKGPICKAFWSILRSRDVRFCAWRFRGASLRCRTSSMQPIGSSGFMNTANSLAALNTTRSRRFFVSSAAASSPRTIGARDWRRLSRKTSDPIVSYLWLNRRRIIRRSLRVTVLPPLTRLSKRPSTSRSRLNSRWPVFGAGGLRRSIGWFTAWLGSVGSFTRRGIRSEERRVGKGGRFDWKSV